jgi:hypothetical protein
MYDAAALIFLGGGNRGIYVQSSHGEPAPAQPGGRVICWLGAAEAAHVS